MADAARITNPVDLTPSRVAHSNCVRGALDYNARSCVTGLAIHSTRYAVMDTTS